VSVEVQVAIVSGILLLFTAVLVELVRGRRATNSVAQAVQTPSGDHSMAELVSTTSADVKDLKKTLEQHGIRLAVVERRFDDHLTDPRSNGKVRR
jgi:hypothetical protein